MLIIFCNMICMLSCKNNIREESLSSCVVDCNPSNYTDFANYLLETLNNLNFFSKEDTLNKLASDIQEGTMKLAKGSIHINDYLEFLLKTRYEYLYSRN